MPIQLIVKAKRLRSIGQNFVRMADEVGKELHKSATNRLVNVARDTFNDNIDVGDHAKRRVLAINKNRSILINLNDVPLRRIIGDIPRRRTAWERVLSRKRGLIPRSFYLPIAYGRTLEPMIPVQRKLTGSSPYRRKNGRIGRRKPITAGGADLTIPVPKRNQVADTIAERLLKDPVTLKAVDTAYNRAFNR